MRTPPTVTCCSRSSIPGEAGWRPVSSPRHGPLAAGRFVPGRQDSSGSGTVQLRPCPGRYPEIPPPGPRPAEPRVQPSRRRRSPPRTGCPERPAGKPGPWQGPDEPDPGWPVRSGRPDPACLAPRRCDRPPGWRRPPPGKAGCHPPEESLAGSPGLPRRPSRSFPRTCSRRRRPSSCGPRQSQEVHSVAGSAGASSCDPPCRDPHRSCRHPSSERRPREWPSRARPPPAPPGPPG